MGSTVDRDTAIARFVQRFEQAGGQGTLSAERLDLALDLLFPPQSPWAERIGPVYTSGQLARWLPGVSAPPISDEAVRDRRRNGRLVGFKTDDGLWAWPAFQFLVRDGRLVPDPAVLELWGMLPWRDADQLELVSWLTGARADLDGATPVQHLKQHGLDDRLVRAAGRLAARVAA